MGLITMLVIVQWDTSHEYIMVILMCEKDTCF